MKKLELVEFHLYQLLEMMHEEPRATRELQGGMTNSSYRSAKLADEWQDFDMIYGEALPAQKPSCEDERRWWHSKNVLVHALSL